MERLTSDQPLGNLKNALNLFYAKDGEAWVRGGDTEPPYQDVRLHDFIRQTIRDNVSEEQAYIADFSDEELDYVMLEWLTDGSTTVEGLIGTLYTAAWAFAEIRARLKAYEDTGLEPEICTNYKQFEDEAVSKGVSFARIVELMEADRDGRLVVLPCKVGDTVYQTDGVRIYESKVKTILFDTGLIAFDERAIGTSIFLSREEAEAALDAQKGGDRNG